MNQNKLTKIDCIEILALQIIKSGERKHIAQGALIPSAYADISSKFTGEPSVFNLVSDYLFETEQITHYDLVWEIPLKTVAVNLYKGDSFGACLEPEHYDTIIVDISTMAH